LGKDRRDGDRVTDVRIAGLARLTGVRARGEIVGPADQPDIGIWPGTADNRQEADQ
jgi:hypothetical protein